MAAPITQAYVSWDCIRSMVSLGSVIRSHGNNAQAICPGRARRDDPDPKRVLNHRHTSDGLSTREQRRRCHIDAVGRRKLALRRALSSVWLGEDSPHDAGAEDREEYEDRQKA